VKLILVTKEEMNWLQNTVMPYLGISQLKLAEDLNHTARYPDIWVEGDTITVTREWARQGKRERKKRLLHESLHIYGLDHMPSIGFYSKPNLDTFSKRVMEKMERRK